MTEFKGWTIGEFPGYFLVMEPGEADWEQFPFTSVKDARVFINYHPLVRLLKLLLGQINDRERTTVNLGRIRDWMDDVNAEVPHDLMAYFNQEERKIIVRSLLTTTAMNLTGAT